MKLLSQRKAMIVSFSIVMSGLLIGRVYSHCQIPCGIYDDPVRLKLIAEHITTIEKSMKQIQTLSKDSTNLNQSTRWVLNKEDHADALSQIVTDYFLVQRIKPAAEDSDAYQKYIRQLTLLHQMLQESMKCKQTTDLIHVEKLRELLEAFATAYQG